MSITIPTPKAKAASKASKREQTQPIQLPEPITEKLRRVCGVAGVDPVQFVTNIIGNLDLADFLIDRWDITDHGTIAELYRMETLTPTGKGGQA